MSTPFKDQLAIDIGNVWFNNCEFCDFHTIDGEQMHVLFDNIELIKRNEGKGTGAEDGIYTDENLIFVPVREFGAKPKIGSVLLIDGKKNYRVTDVTAEDGVYSIRLEAVRVR